MTTTELQIKKLQEELDWLMQSEAIRSMSEKDEHGNHKYDICGLDRCIKELHKRSLEAEKRAQAAQAEAVLYRRQIEALMDDRDVKTYPVHNSPAPVGADFSPLPMSLVGEGIAPPASLKSSNCGPILPPEGGPIL